MTHTDPLALLAAARRILAIFAHPDDEILIIPGLVDLCPGREVKIIYATDGLTGECLRGLCECESIGAVRTRELQASAARYGFHAVQAGLPSVGGMSARQQDRAWDAAAGGSVREAIAAEVAAFRPDAVITFDPRHGTTAHPGSDLTGEHMLVGRLVLQALACTYPRERIVMLASVLTFEGGAIGFRPGFDDPGIHTYPVDASGWEHIVSLMRHYRSQFSDEWIAGAEAAPDALRTISLQLASTYPRS